MLQEIGTADRIPEFIARAKDKNDPFRLMGFGHRVYKNYDPRAKIMQKTCHEVLAELGIQDDPLLEVAMELERIALTDEYFIEKKLYPNIDFYSGITLKALGFPTTMFTVLFAVARTVGWIAQWKEMVEDPSQKIGRPRQLYTGAHAPRLRADLQAPLDPPARRWRRALSQRRQHDVRRPAGRRAVVERHQFFEPLKRRQAGAARSGVSLQAAATAPRPAAPALRRRREIPGSRFRRGSGSAARSNSPAGTA